MPAINSIKKLQQNDHFPVLLVMTMTRLDDAAAEVPVSAASSYGTKKRIELLLI